MAWLASIPRRLESEQTALAPARWGDRSFLAAVLGAPAYPLRVWLVARRAWRPLWVVRAGPERIGLAGLYDLRVGVEARLTVVLDDAYRGAGHGTRVFRLLCQALAERAVVRRLLAEVAPDNAPCLAALRSAGFEEVDRRRGHVLLARELGG